MRASSWIVLALVGTIAVACKSTPSTGTGGLGGGKPSACAPGEQSACTCTGTDTGVQTCAEDGSQFGSCQCSDTGVDAGPDAPSEGGGSDSGPPLQTPSALISGLSGVQDLAVYTNSLFWTAADGSGSVAQCAVAGCLMPTVLASSQGFPRSLGVSAGVVVWSVYQTGDPDGGFGVGFLGRATAGLTASGQVYLGSQDHADALAADPNHVYWSASGQILQCDLFGCTTPITLATETAQAIAVDASYVYWTGAKDGHVSRCDIGGCIAPTALSTEDLTTSRGLVVAGGNVYWAGTTEVLSCPATGCAGAPTVVATQQNIVALRHPLAADGTHVYWSTDKSVVRCPLAGCGGAAPQPVAVGQSEPTSVAVDPTFVYWVDGDTIKRVGKPQ